MSEWRDIESAPKDGTFVLLWGPRWRTPQVQHWAKVKDVSAYGWVSEAGRSKGYLPTHWRPVPAPPSVTGSSTHGIRHEQEPYIGEAKT